MDSKKDQGGFISGVVIGAVIGGILGLLFAPEEGSKTREKLKKKYEENKAAGADIVETIADAIEEMSARAQPLVEEIQNNIKPIVDRVEEMSKPVRDHIADQVDTLRGEIVEDDEKPKKS